MHLYADMRADENTASVKNDPVNHPSHYTSGKIEVIDFIEDQKLNMHLIISLRPLKNTNHTQPSVKKQMPGAVV